MGTETSRAIQFHTYGEPLEVLCDSAIDVGEPNAGRVRVRVRAVGLNPADWELCRGTLMANGLPRGIGYDVAGTIDAVGVGVDGVTVGDMVFGTADWLGQPSAGAAEVAILDSWYAIQVDVRGVPVFVGDVEEDVFSADPRREAADQLVADRRRHTATRVPIHRRSVVVTAARELSCHRRHAVNRSRLR